MWWRLKNAVRIVWISDVQIHIMIESHDDLIWLQEGLIWYHVIWFAFDLNSSWFDCDLNKSQESVIWADWNRMWCSTTFANSHMPIGKQTYFRKLRKNEVICVLYNVHTVFAKSGCRVFSQAELLLFLNLKFVIWFDLRFRLKWFVIWGCDLRFDLWFGMKIYIFLSKDMWFGTDIWFETCPSLVWVLL